jgi:hypothetical protein
MHDAARVGDAVCVAGYPFLQIAQTPCAEFDVVARKARLRGFQHCVHVARYATAAFCS